MATFRQLIQYGRFPALIQPHLLEWCPSEIEHLMKNPTIHAEHLLPAFSTKTPASTTEDFLTWGGAPVAERIVFSKERRDGICRSVMSGYYMNREAQMAFAAKSLSNTVADEFIDDHDHLDEACLLLASRASTHSVVGWLARATSLSDDQVVEVLLAKIESKDPRVGTNGYAALAQICASRPAVRRRMLAAAPHNLLSSVLVAGFTPEDEPLVMQRLSEQSQFTPSLIVDVLANPNLSRASAEVLYARLSSSRFFGPANGSVWHPISGLHHGDDLSTVDDPSYAFKLLAMNLVYPDPIRGGVVYAQLANSSVIEDEDLARQLLGSLLRAAKAQQLTPVVSALVKLQQRTGVEWSSLYPGASSDVDLWANLRGEVDARRQRLANDDRPVWRKRDRDYTPFWVSDTRTYDVKQLESYTFGPRWDSDYTQVYDLTRHLATVFGDGSDDRSLALWRNAFVLMPRHKGTIKQLIATVSTIVAGE